MSDYIRREDALMAVCRADLPDKTEDGTPILNGKRKVSDCVRRIKAIPAADVVERKRGEWIRVTEELGESWMCSECVEEFIPHDGMEEFASYAHFCPNCGADMREENGNV